MILAKSALRKAIADRELQFLDDDGRTLPEWFGMIDGMLGLGTDGDPVALQPASVDLTLGDHWLVPEPNEQDPPWTKMNGPNGSGPHIAIQWAAYSPKWTDSRAQVPHMECTGPSFLIPAHGFVLARTRETVSLSPSLFGKVEGRSSVGRLGLVVETAGVIDPGFRGTITLEIANLLPYPVLLHAGTRICQIVVSRMDGDTEGGYQSSKYQNQVQATGSKLYKDFQK